MALDGVLTARLWLIVGGALAPGGGLLPLTLSQVYQR